ncbi:MAG: type II toxin-antitoxin system HicB family antitoxin [Tepidiformaceae bacterium]
MKYAVVVEVGEKNYASYVPDLPGCVSTGKSRPEIERNIREAIEFHIEGLRITGQPGPAPTACVEMVELSGLA